MGLINNDCHIKDHQWQYSAWETLNSLEINSLSTTNPGHYWLEEFADAYREGKFIWVGGNLEDMPRIQDRLRVRKMKNWDDTFEIQDNYGEFRFVVFDECPGKSGLQLIRVLEKFRGQKGNYSITEIGRWLLDPANHTIYAVKIPDYKFNPSEVCYPFIQEGDRSWELEGGRGNYIVSNLDDVVFWIKHVVPGITFPEGLLRLLISTSRTGKTYSADYHFGYKVILDLFIDGSLTSTIIRECPWIIPEIYGNRHVDSYTVTRDRSKYDYLIGLLREGFRPSTFGELWNRASEIL